MNKVECGYLWRSGGSCLNAKNTGWGIVVPGSLVKMEDEGGEAWASRGPGCVVGLLWYLLLLSILFTLSRREKSTPEANNAGL